MLLKKVEETIERYHLLEKGDRLIVGVSAGVDSMVLLHILHSLRQTFDISLIVAHLHHGLRPQESRQEAELVRNESRRLGLPFEYGRFDVKDLQKLKRLSLQDAARRIRFHFLNHLLHQYGAHKIALGHHADDQVETVLLRLLRGSGSMGLKGMLPIRDGRVIRPLIEVWRREIESYAKEMDIPSLQDSSNLKSNYLRNRLRLNLIPFIEQEVQPDFKKVVMKASMILRDENDFLEKTTEEIYQRMVREEKGALLFQGSEFQSIHPAIQWRLLQKIFHSVPPGGRTEEEGEGVDIRQIYKRVIQPSKSFFMELPFGICLEKRYDRISLERRKPKPIPPFEVELPLTGPTFIKEIGKQVVIRDMLKEDWPEGFERSPFVALLDYRCLQFPLKVRNFRPGDRFQPMGIKGTQKLKEFFIDHKIPRMIRPQVPLLISGEKIVWVAGYRISEGVKITEKTQRILKVDMIDKSNAQFLKDADNLL